MAFIDQEILNRYASAFSDYEIVNHGVDPREDLSGTSMRIGKDEGYKYRVLKNWDNNREKTETYVDAVLLTLPGYNLVNHHQVTKIKNMLSKNGTEKFEKALVNLYEGEDDEKAFKDVVKVVGANFDVLGFLFFLKDPNRYLPIKSSLFEQRFKMLGIDAHLPGNCNWETYERFNSWIKEINNYLKESINPEFTLLDSHSFVWLLPEIKKYLEHEDDEYQRAAKILKSYVIEEGFEIPTSDEEIEAALDEFKDAYSPEMLEEIDEESLLPALFYTIGDNANALCCYIEMNKACKAYFGSISGGSAYKFGLFQKKESGRWMTGSPQKPQELTEEEALELGKEIRDVLVKGAQLIDEADPHTLEDYEKMDVALHDLIGDRFYNLGWIHKYFSIIFNDKLSCFHSTDWQMHVLRALRISPSEKYYARSGQIAMVQKCGGWYYRQLFDVINEKYGAPKQFVRLGSSDEEKKYVSEWAKRQVIGIGWGKLGDLSEYLHGEGLDKKDIQDKLSELYYENNSRMASRKAGEILKFYSTNDDSVVVIMDGERLVALADNIGDYFYDKSSPMPHLKRASWKFVFDKNQKLPGKPEEGKLTTCYQFTDEGNLQFLYEKYYYGESKDVLIDGEPVKQEKKSIKFISGLSDTTERNRILFGAPGTGKSFILDEEAKKLLSNDDTRYERVTFHPDYSYANFVGTYKPVPYKDSSGNDAITYEYVPGPFMRVYVKALKNCQEEQAKPFLLIIEEINRANAAAVFGDVFQLLDRDDENVSQYPIQASEDIKTYLAKELGGKPENYAKIQLPDNMFIWATMNSADQGVFPMDTAFKRRWEFTYIGINDSEAGIKGKTVILGTGTNARVVEWNELRKAINDRLSSFKINEDKLLGPYFLSKKIVPTDSEINRDNFITAFKNKVLMYLFDDAAKQKRLSLFADGVDTTKYSTVCKAFDVDGVFAFCSEISGRFTNIPNEGMDQ